MVLKTPYFRTVPDILKELPVSNYTPYQVFCLSTRLEAINQREEPSYILKPISVYLENRMALVIKVFSHNDEIDLEEEEEREYQRAIDLIVTDHPDHCLLSQMNAFRDYPVAWVRSVWPYLAVEDKYQPWKTEDGIYVNLRDEIDYWNTYNQLRHQLEEQLALWYAGGVVVASPLQAEQLNLEIVEEGLYKPNWRQDDKVPDRVLYFYQRVLQLE